MSAIRAEGLTRRFGDITAVENVSFDVARGEIFGFLGPNGSGKTVTIKMLCGILPISDGNAWVDDIDVRSDPDSVRTRIGYMSQKFALYDDLTVLENLRFYGRVYGLKGKSLESRISRMIESNRLDPYVRRSAGKLSGGWKQRLALGCAMLHEPRILYLDEPTAGIDPVARRELWDQLFALSATGITFFVTTHYMDEAERCGHLAYLYYGRLIADGTPDTLRALPEINTPGTARVEITGSDTASLLTVVRSLPMCRSATLFGRSVHALVDATLSLEQLRAELSARGAVIIDLRALLPSLEDVFVELTRRRQLEIGSAA